MWPFKKKVEDTASRELRKFEIPEEHVRHISELRDKLGALDDSCDRVARLNLWNAICELFPEVKQDEDGFYWYVDTPSVFRIVIEERVH